MKQILLICMVQLCAHVVNAQGAWTQKANFGGDARTYGVGFNIAGKGYIGLGQANELKNDFWEYDPIGNTWTQKADFGGIARRWPVGFSIAGKGYAGTGVRDVVPEDIFDPPQIYEHDLWEYDPTGNSWTKKADLPARGRWGGCGFSIGNKGYLGIGLGAGSNDFWEYDPATDKWTRKADFPGGERFRATGFSVGNKGYIGIGVASPGNSTPNDFWEYNPVTDTWTRKADFAGGGRINAVGFSIGTKGYMGTGGASSGYLNDFWEYDPSTDGWTQKANLNGAARLGATGFSIGNKVYIGTGYVGNNYLKDFWEYSLVSQITTTAITGGPYCAGDNIAISFTANGTTNTGNTFTAQLSNAAGSFTNPVTIGTLTASESGSINGTIPSATLSGSGYRVRVVSSDPVITGSDNGADIIINALITYYYDADGDGYGDPNAPTQLCSVQKGYVLDNTDCDDTKGGINPATVWYKDADNDGYSDGTTARQCTRPTNYKLTSELTATSDDCDDADASVNPSTLWYKDEDNDGYSDGTMATQCTQPGGYKRVAQLTALTGDCNDSDASLNPATVWYKDADNDGYSDGTAKAQCVRPTDYKSTSELMAITGDCNDADASLNPATVWYKDADNDGYSDGATAKQCIKPTGYKPAGELTAITGDCNDADGSVHAPQTYYLDFDKDGYGDPGKTTSVCSSAPPAGFVSNNKDCNDNNAGINPGAVEVCGNGIDDNCNGKVDEAGCTLCANGTGLTTTSITSSGAVLKWNALANAVQWEIEYKKTATGSKWITITLPGTARSLTLSSLLANQNYKWHLRAKCNKTWTSFSNDISFKTLTAQKTSNAITQQARPLNVAEEESQSLKLYPNPNKGQFMIELHLASNINAKARIEMINVMGQTVSAENTNISNGLLQKKVSISSSLTSGIYIVKTVVNDKIYFSKLKYDK